MTKGYKKINAIHSQPEPDERFKPPHIPAVLRGDFVDFVIDMIQGPAAVRTYLCKKHGLHKVPVFSDNVNHDVAST